jgi:hypothetical protein
MTEFARCFPASPSGHGNSPCDVRGSIMTEANVVNDHVLLEDDADKAFGGAAEAGRASSGLRWRVDVGIYCALGPTIN